MTLSYHDVLDAGVFPPMAFADARRYAVTRGLFLQHLYEIDGITGCEVAGTAANETQERPDVMLTFDDGGLSGTPVGAILSARSLIGHFFIPTGMIGRPGFMDCDQLRSLRRAGHVVGSHSHTHPERMSSLRRHELVREWRTSVSCLSGILDEPVTNASVAGGYYSRKVAEAAAEAGITMLFTSEPTTKVWAVGPCVVFGRFPVFHDTTAAQIGQVLRGDGFRRCLSAWAWQAKKIAKAVGGRYYLGCRKVWLKHGDRPNSPGEPDLRYAK